MLYALTLEDGWTGSMEIIETSKSRNKLYKLLKEYINDGYNEALLNIVEMEPEELED